jgi:hypothetical protein
MAIREDANWSRTAEVLALIARRRQTDSPDATAVGVPGSSSCASARTIPTEFASRDPEEREYVSAVLECYLWLPGTASVVSRNDRRCAQQLYRRGVPLAIVRSAMIVAVARRTFRSGDPLPRVRAVHYFLPVVEELQEFPCDPGYVEYMQGRLRPLAEAKTAEATRR